MIVKSYDLIILRILLTKSSEILKDPLVNFTGILEDPLVSFHEDLPLSLSNFEKRKREVRSSRPWEGVLLLQPVFGIIISKRPIASNNNSLLELK